MADASTRSPLLDGPFVLTDPAGWARFPCADCNKPLKVGDRVVMKPVCGGFTSHPRHHDRRKCR